MAALAREVYHPMARYVKKQVFGIRHGEAWHNILHSKLGDDAYNNFQDATLTTRGMSQASSNATSMPAPDLILVSPLMRTLQTADIIWPNTPKVALECLQEYPQQTQIINKRSSKSILEGLFPQVDFSDLKTEEQKWPRHNPERDMLRIKYIISNCSAHTICIVTHSTWLKFCLMGSLDSSPELEHCRPYILDL